MTKVLLQLKTSLATVIVNILDCFMVSKRTSLPPRNYWKQAVNNCANLVETGMGREKPVMIIVGISGGCASVCNALLSPESRYIPYFLLFSFILRAVGPILSFSPFIL